jgi:transcriptional regulator with XRE-family HTH domain
MVKSIKISGKKLARMREELFFSQERFAQEVGQSRGNIARLEAEDVVGILPSKFRQMAEGLKIPADELMKRIGVNGLPTPQAGYLKKAAKPPGGRGPRPKKSG